MKRKDMKCKNMNMYQPRQAGTHAGKGGNTDEVNRLVEPLALASVRGSAQKVYSSKWQTWCRMRAIEGTSSWLAEKEGVDAAVKALTNFMVLRCFASKIQSQTIRGCLAAINYFHKMFAG